MNKKTNNRPVVVNGVIWSSKYLSEAIVTTLFTSYISFYATDVLGMKATLIAFVLLITKLFDGVSDLIAGVVVDNTKTRFGKARPYDWCIPFIAVFTVLTFSAPIMDTKLQAIWIGAMYIITQAVFNTLLGASDSVYLLRAFPEEKERNNVFSIGMIFGQFVSLVMTSVFPVLVAQAGTTHSAWTRIVIIGTVPFAAIGMIRFFTIKEVVDVEEAEDTKKAKNKIGFKDAFWAIVKNKYILILTLAVFIIVICSGLLNSAAMYYFTYFIGDAKKMSIIGIASFSSLVMIVIFVPLANKFGKCNVMKAGLIIAALGNVLRWIGGVNMTTTFIGLAALMFGIMPISVYFPLFLFDIMDYSEWKTGKRVEGGLAVFPNFAHKVASGIAVSLAGFIMGAAGYDGKLAVQTESAMNAINLSYNVLPTILMLIMVVIIVVFYNIDNELPTVKADLEARRSSTGGEV